MVIIKNFKQQLSIHTDLKISHRVLIEKVKKIMDCLGRLGLQILFYSFVMSEVEGKSMAEWAMLKF